MKPPKVPWKNMAAIGGAVRINVMRISPIPPCCIAWLLKPPPVATSNRKSPKISPIQNATDNNHHTTEISKVSPLAPWNCYNLSNNLSRSEKGTPIDS
jgi:hypothetical protein